MMAEEILTETAGYVQIDHHPDQCPICHTKVSPLFKHARVGRFVRYGAVLEIVYVCPHRDCNEFFIAYYNHLAPAKLVGSRPIEPAPVTFDASLMEISPTYCSIFDEATRAEQYGLLQICGVGYRKALEFLVKDYLIREQATNKLAIEKMMLGLCIDKYVADSRIKEVARRATWLGNDETHYHRRWIDKELKDLKRLIDLVCYWINAEYLTKEALEEMPDPGKA